MEKKIEVIKEWIKVTEVRIKNATVSKDYDSVSNLTHYKSGLEMAVTLLEIPETYGICRKI